MSILPSVNAFLNTASACFLIAGYTAIRLRNIRFHKVCMLAACVTSALFLIFYILYHYSHGTTRFGRQGPIRLFYFTLLISHTVLAIVQIPLIILTLTRALKNQIDRHKKIARITLPIWLYVSVTGVVVYWVLYRLP